MMFFWVLVFGGVWLLVRPGQTAPVPSPQAEPRTVVPRGDLAADELATIEVFRNASPSVVYITHIEYARLPFSFNVEAIPQGTGSGFLWDRDGHVVTNFHVIYGAAELRVRLADHSEWPARAIGYEPDKDLAVLKIDAPQDRLKSLPIGASGDLLVGQKVFAIGNPFGFDQTLTTGVVSALGREITSINGRPIRDVIQTDAAINPGNSGGPLLDSSGRLIGVNTQIASPSGANAGIGFAVPVDIVNRVVPQIIRHGRVIRPGLGIQPLPDNYARQLDLKGVLIVDIIKGTNAERAGLRGTVFTRDGRIEEMGDIITKINDQPITTLYSLLDELEKHAVGDEVRVSVLRDKEPLELTVRLQSIN
jgi:S1-C subfamily serine protease